MGPRAWHSRACPPASLRKVPLPASLPSRALMDHPSFRALLTCHRFRTSSQLPPPSPHLQVAEVTALSSVLLKHRLASCLIPLRLFHPGRFLPRNRLLVLPGQEEQGLCLIHSRCPRRAQKRVGHLKDAPSVPVELNHINLILRRH